VKASRFDTTIRFIEPMYALAANGLPEGAEWFYEVKLDGYRCLAGRDSTSVTLWSRRGNVFTLQFPGIARACESLEPGTLLDGEIVAIDESGRSSFNILQHHRSKASALRFYVFDLLYDRGQSLLKVPLSRRRELLRKAVTSLKDPILLSEAFDAEPSELVRAAKELTLEGVIAKRKDSFYESGKQSKEWLCATYPQRSLSALQGPTSRRVPIREPSREKAYAMGFDAGRNEKLRVAKASACGADRVCGVDAGWSP
jgi:bifunctional non-homologous end joining protein LigD